MSYFHVYLLLRQCKKNIEIDQDSTKLQTACFYGPQCSHKIK